MLYIIFDILTLVYYRIDYTLEFSSRVTGGYLYSFDVHMLVFLCH